MGNGIGGKLNLCFAGDAGEISRRRNDIAVYLSDPLDEGYGHSFCYIRPDAISKAQFSDEPTTFLAATAFRTISGASISANTSTPLTTALVDIGPYSCTSLDKASAFESSNLFSSIPLQPIPRNSVSSARSGPISRVSYSGSLPLERSSTSGPRESFASARSGPISRLSGSSSDPIEGGFMSGPIERIFTSGPLENQPDQFQRYRPKKPKKWASFKSFKKMISKSLSGSKVLSWPEKNNNSTLSSSTISNNNVLSSQASLIEDEDDDDDSSQVQWAQGKAGEDRVHVVISEEHGWVFVGIYDGFNGPDATDFLLNNLYSNVYKELKGLLWNDKSEASENSISNESTYSSSEVDLKKEELGSKLNEKLNRLISGCDYKHSEVLKALSEGLRKTEESYLEIADMMVTENPELALMGSCVLVMLMKGDDVYLMNVGDSRAVLAQKVESDRGTTKAFRDSVNDLEAFDSDELNNMHNLLTSCQLTMDHCTSVRKEVQRIKREHPDDASAVFNDRVKGSLKVTRAFGAGFLKQPKWNDALLEMFRIDYVGTSPYISCLPSLYHHRLGARDKFLILSSDGLYQYFTNTQAVSEVEMFMSIFPEGDPAQHLVEKILFRAAKKAGMDFHELLDIPQGDRRKYHDDVSIIIISFEGRIWRSCV